MARKYREDNLAYSKAYREAHREELREKSRAYYKLNIDKERIRSKLKAQKNSEKRKIYEKNYRKLHKAAHAACEAKRRFIKANATPKWLTKEQLNEMQEFYILAKELRWLSEEPLEVDHIIPLKGKNMTGLHVPWNLRIVPMSINRSKSNKVEV